MGKNAKVMKMNFAVGNIISRKELSKGLFFTLPGSKNDVLWKTHLDESKSEGKCADIQDIGKNVN